MIGCVFGSFCWCGAVLKFLDLCDSKWDKWSKNVIKLGSKDIWKPLTPGGRNHLGSWIRYCLSPNNSIIMFNIIRLYVFCWIYYAFYRSFKFCCRFGWTVCFTNRNVLNFITVDPSINYYLPTEHLLLNLFFLTITVFSRTKEQVLIR